MMDFDGRKLTALRKRNRLTQAELGSLVGKKAEHVCHYEKDRAAPPAGVILTWLHHFKASPTDLGTIKAN